MSQPITRQEALRISQSILSDAEHERSADMPDIDRLHSVLMQYHYERHWMCDRTNPYGYQIEDVSNVEILTDCSEFANEVIELLNTHFMAVESLLDCAPPCPSCVNRAICLQAGIKYPNCPDVARVEQGDAFKGVEP